jgi:chemosensory pili system protein ChpA (sensor histidine kinase/response regulator)
MISVQPQLAKSLFRFDAETGSLSAVMGQTERTSAFAVFDAIEAPAPPTLRATPLLERVRDLSAAAARPGVTDADLAQRLEGVVQQALADEQPELARLLGGAAHTLRSGAGAGDAARQSLRDELAGALLSLQGVAPEAPAAPAAVPPPRPAPPGGTGLEDDAEMRDIFIEEAREVVGGARGALDHMADAPDSVADMTVLRRAFHTLKGSSRMVGLRDFGEAAWASEQLYNARLAQAAHMDAPLRAFTDEALAYLADWVEAIASGADGGHYSAAVSRSADALRLGELRVPIEPPQPHDVPAEDEPALPVALVEAELPLEALPELQFAALPDTPPVSTAQGEVVAAPDTAAAEALDFEFDLDAEATAPTATETLRQFVPELPAAADLDLELLPPDTERPAAELPAVEELNFELDLGDFGEAPADEAVAEALVAEEPEVSTPAPVPGIEFEPVPEALPEADVEAAFALPALELTPQAPPPDEDEQVKVIGPLRIGIPLFNIFLNEADELSRRLVTELAEWALEHERHAVPESCVALAHSLAGNSATVGYAELSALARALEHALSRSRAHGRGRSGEPVLFTAAAEEIRRLLHQFAAGFLHGVPPALMEGLAEHERLPMEAAPEPDPGGADLAPDETGAQPVLPAMGPFAEGPGVGDDDDIDAIDAIDGELFPIFEDEAEELLPQLQARLREWWSHPGDAAAPAACMRTLHTFKGGARLAGAMRLGEMAHRLETVIEQLRAQEGVHAAQVEPLLVRGDAMAAAFAALRARPATAPVAAIPWPAAAPPAVPAAEPPLAEPASAGEIVPEAGPAPAPQASAVAIDWGRFPAVAAPAVEAGEPGAMATAGGGASVRVRAGLLDRLVNQAGEVSITRARIDADVKLLQGSLVDLTDSLERMRRQLRDIELQAETQISTRIEAAKAAAQSFDPLEMDRFTRFQELTRFMAESVNDVATLQRSLQRTLQSAEDELAAQARLTRELQDDLLRTRMVEFESLADRLYRTLRQAAKDSGKQVRLDIVGGAIEVDRGVLERMVGPFEHLLRNAVAHGIETPEQRQRAGKDATGLITISVAQAGNEVALDFSDDGAGLDSERIRTRAVERGLLAADAHAGEAELAEFIFSPGFSTAATVTELAGRGVGLDVVRAEVVAMGGRVETASVPGQGTRMRLLLPLTTAVTQVVMLRCGELQVAVPSPLIEIVRRVPTAEVERGYEAATVEYAGASLPFFWLAALLGGAARGATSGRTQSVVVVRSAAQRVALHVDEVLGNQEVVVKNVGPQLARLPGLAGVTLLPSGSVAPIYNPVALAAFYGAGVRAGALPAALPVAARAPAPPRAPMVMVVDDSLTVRRVTQRLLVREGYRVVTAKDGLEALEKLAQERPVVLLSDIEMPRMDGFELLRNVRADARLAGLPVVMITSRIAQKHRDYAVELGADHYLGKPYSEDELLQIVASYADAEGADIPT